MTTMWPNMIAVVSAVGTGRSAVSVPPASRRWLSFLRLGGDMRTQATKKWGSIFTVVVFFALSLTVFAADEIKLQVEVRYSKSAPFDTNTDLEFVTDTTSEGGLLHQAKENDDDDFRIFQNSFNLLARERRRSIIIYTHSLPKNQPDQVFLLSMPRKPKAMDWTIWRHPDYVATNADWNFIRGYKSANRSTNIPANSFELRYRVELP